MSKTLAEISAFLDGTTSGDATVVIHGLAGLLDAEAGDLSFASAERYRPLIAQTQATAIVVPTGFGDVPLPSIVVDRPDEAMNRLVALFRPSAPEIEPGVAPSASIAPTATLGANVTVMPNVTIMSGAKVGAGTTLFPGVFVGTDVQIGVDSVIHPNVSLRSRVRIGDRVVVHAGSVIGADGFGYRSSAAGHEKVEHIGSVVIEDDVEIGANVTIDRARFGRTRVGQGSKIDNLVHIGHNVQIGRACMVIAQTGISGSSVLADGCAVGGQAGIVGHVRIGAGARLAARSGISKDVPDGAIVYGFVAGDHRVRKREEAAVRRLPDLIRRVRALESLLGRTDLSGSADRVEFEGEG